MTSNSSLWCASLDPPNSSTCIHQVAYSRILQLTYVDELLVSLKSLFVKLFEPFLTTFVASLHALQQGKTAVPSSWDFNSVFEGWDKVFDKLLRGLEDKAALVSLLAQVFLADPAQERKSRLRTAPRQAPPSDSSPPSDDPSTGKSL